VAVSESVKGLTKQQTFERARICTIGQVLYKCFTAVNSEGNPMTGPVIVEKS
jgi:hypothetical protein